ncbi:MAG TPA: peroxidase-related enzyme [Thermoanaerobaculia bacterium]|nr:peroxidase-related enzyme [Thermoanaerobaculia bacterium]
MADAVMTDYRQASLSDADRAMLDFAIKLTRSPAGMVRSDVERLRNVGFDDTAIHDIVQVAALFNYYNRLADGLGIDDEPDWSP